MSKKNCLKNKQFSLCLKVQNIMLNQLKNYWSKIHYRLKKYFKQENKNYLIRF